jgi:ABC-type dipeptide/oligopeptide/nickel transport system permease component
VPGSFLRRLLLIPPTLLGVAIVVFILLRIVPGDPISMMLPPGATSADIERLRTLYGLDLPWSGQFLTWLGGLVQGDLGTSISLRQDVGGLILSRLPATIELVGIAFAGAVFLGTLLAVTATLLRALRADWIVDGVVGFLTAVPDFLWALIFILAFGVAAPILPISGRIDPRLPTDFATGFYLVESLVRGQFAVFGDLVEHAVLPATALALPLAALVARTLSASLAVEMGQDYVQVARSRGYGPLRLVLREALRNAAIPTLALTGVQLTFLIGGTVLVERIFAYQGLGNLAIDAVVNRDLPLIQGLILVFAAIFILVTLLVDLAASLLDPRQRRAQA